jgi:hypothetical protein
MYRGSWPIGQSCMGDMRQHNPRSSFPKIAAVLASRKGMFHPTFGS